MASNGAGELVAAVNGVVYPLSNDECVFRARDTGEKHVMTIQVLRALDLCSYFRTLDDHVQTVMNGIAELKGREEDVRRVLEALRNRGLMITAGDTLAAMAEADAPAPDTAGVMVRSTGRKDELDNLLQSLDSLREAFDAAYPCYVFDDSRDPERAAACERACARWRERGLAVHWLDGDWQRRFMKDLVERSGQPEAVLDWLLGPRKEAGFTGGRAMNLILLAAAGCRFLLVDEDLVLAPRASGDATGISLANEGWDVWFHRDAKQAAMAGDALDVDPVAEHLRYLGRPVPAALKALAGRPDDLRGVDQRLLQSLDDASGLIGTVSGIYGDAATSSNLWCYTLSGTARERFRGTREDYDRNRRTRWVTRTRPRSSLLDHSNFTRNGLDGSRLLPPTLPFGRKEDKFQNSLTTYLHPRSRVLEFPWALGHFPLEERGWSFEARKEPIEEGLSGFLSDTLLQSGGGMPGEEPGTRLTLAAEMLGDLARRSDRELTDRLDEYRIYIRSDLVQQLQRQLAAEPHAPVYWAADVRAIIEANGKALTGSGFPRLADMPPEAEAGESLAWLRKELGMLSDALHAWPRLRDAARELDPLPG